MRTKLVTQLSYNISNAVGCCGIGTISRLHAKTVLPARKAVEIQRYATSKTPCGYFDNVSKWQNDPMRSILRRINNMPNNLQKRWNGGGVSTDIAYMSVLDTLLRGPTHVAYYMSDNVEGEGDVHLGPFNTRDFHQWMVAHNLCGSITTGPMISRKTNRALQAWIIQPCWDFIDKYIEVHEQELYDVVLEINNHDNIKKRREATIARSAREIDDLRRELSDW